jgi:hypothetical protein
MGEVYLVLEYERKKIYIPFSKLEYVDAFTCGYEDKLELCEIINKYLELGIPKDEMLDAYLSESIYKVNDDMQEFNNRSLAIKYKHDNYDIDDLKNKLASFMKYKKDKIYIFRGLKQVVKNYKNKYRGDKTLLDADYNKIAKAYIGVDYKRQKECYFKLKDMNYKIKINKLVVDPTKTNIQLEEEDKMNLCWFTNMHLEDLKEYVNNQIKGRSR